MPDQNSSLDHPRIFWKKIATAFLISFYLIATALVAGLYSLERAYADKIYPGVTLAGLDFSGKTWEIAAEEVDVLLGSLEQTTLSIAFEGGKVFTPTLTELGVSFDRDQVLEKLFAIGHNSSPWMEAISFARSITGGQSVDLAPSFDRDLLTSYVDQTTAALAQKPQNPVLRVVGGTVEIVPGAAGQKAEASLLEQAIAERLTNLVIVNGTVSFPPVSLTIDYVEPAIDEADLPAVKKEAQEMIGDPIVMELDGRTFTFTTADIGSWLVFKEVEKDGEKTYAPQFDDEKISASIVNKVAKQVEIKMVPRKILITTGQVIDEGKDGRILDRARLLSEIKNLLATRTRATLVLGVSDVPKTEQQVYPDFTLGLFEGKYIEINLTKQMLYAIEGNNLVGSYPISSGREWGGYATPTGTMYIKNKIGLAYSRRYVLWMPYWNGLSWNQDGSGYEGYGIHELPCFNRACTRREGIRHLGIPVSHGCIRLGHNGPAEFIYNWAPVGTPVYIHR